MPLDLDVRQGEVVSPINLGDIIHIDHGLAPDIVYGLDNLLENDFIDSGTHAILRLYATSKDIDVIFEHTQSIDPERTFQHFTVPARTSRREPTGISLIKFSFTLLDKLTPDMRAHIDALSIAWVCRAIQRLSDVVRDWSYADETTGGAMKPWRQNNRVVGSGREAPRIARRLRSPKYVKRATKSFPETQQLRRIADLLLARVDNLATIGSMTESAARGSEDFVRGYSKIIERERLERIEFEWDRYRAAQRSTVMRRLGDGPLKTKIKHVKQTRKVLKRASSMAATIVGSSNVSLLAQGKSIVITGKNIDLRVESTASLAQKNHGALDVYVLAKSIGETEPDVLAKICVYIEDTPALDQVTAFCLMMQAGEEDEIIASSNLISVTEEGLKHPILTKMHERRRQERDAIRASIPENWQTVAASGGIRMSNKDSRICHSGMFQAWKQKYGQETGPMWVERMAVEVLGRRAKTFPIQAMARMLEAARPSPNPT